MSLFDLSGRRALVTGGSQGIGLALAHGLAAALRAARVNRLSDDEDHRTPWEQGVRGAELIGYERDMMRRSAANLRALGLME